MSLSIGSLRPYQSFILARTKTKAFDLEVLAGEVKRLVGLSPNGPRREVSVLSPTKANGLLIAGVHYVHQRQASWTSDPNIFDTINHLVLLVERSGLLLLHFTESRAKQSVSAELQGGTNPTLGTLEVVPEKLLHTAFVRGSAKTLWLSGTHRPSTWKADNKVLTGIDLRDALDPLGDQTYHFTAARVASAVGQQQLVTGITPKRSQVWIGTSRNWQEFTAITKAIIDHIKNTNTPTENPLPVVAASTSDLTAVTAPCEIAIMPQELDEEPDTDQRQKQENQDIAATTFDITSKNVQNATATALRHGDEIGTFTFTLKASTKPGRFEVSIACTKKSNGHDEECDAIIKQCQNGKQLKVWFESGHTFVDGSLFHTRYRDLPFPITFENFKDYDVRREKPSALDQIGNEQSLFCWVLNVWAKERRDRTKPKHQWLLCDDGAHEKADFICVEDHGGHRTLTLLHVKGVHSKSNNLGSRDISVADYEVVIGQAIKNVRWIDRLAGPSPTDNNDVDKKYAQKFKRAWKDGKLNNNPPAINTLLQPQPIRAEVIVVQPQVTDKATKNTKGLGELRLKQLYALCHQAKVAAASLGAEFNVIGERLPQTKKP